jgi:hypothetical protein
VKPAGVAYPLARLTIEEDLCTHAGQESRDPVTPSAQEARMEEDFQEKGPGD